MKSEEIPLFGFRKSEYKILISKYFNYMGYGLLKFVGSGHFENKWHSWALIY
jgi:hypothetical protein